MTSVLYGVLLVVGVVLLVVTVMRVLLGGLDDGRERPGRPASSNDVSAREILDQRYAAGQLSTEEYRNRLRVLEEGGS